jgi:ABC-2 type transport system permease protein
VVAPQHPPTRTATVAVVAGRTARGLLRSPQVLGIAVVQAVMFLLMFRYVIGGAIGVEGVTYVDFLVPGFVVAGLLFTAGGSAVAVAEDATSGLHDRLRSLPVAPSAVLAGRAAADAGLMLLVAGVTLLTGVAVGFRSGAGAVHLAGAAGLLLVFATAFAGVFLWIGLSSGSAQAAQGLGILAVPFSFVSSAFVPVETMPGVLQAFAQVQPLTFMVNAWRGLTLGDPMVATFDHSLTYYVAGSLLWSVALLAAVAPMALRAYRRR